MNLDEFLRWSDIGPRYELVRGELRPRQIAPATHDTLIARMGALIDSALRFRSEHVGLIGSAVAISGRRDTCYFPDLVVAPTPDRWGQLLVSDPWVIIEVVSSETYRYDLQVKRPDYMSINGLREIISVDSDATFAEILRRDGEQWFSEYIHERAAVISLASVGSEISMAELYEGFVFPEDEAVPAP